MGFLIVSSDLVNAVRRKKMNCSDRYFVNKNILSNNQWILSLVGIFILFTPLSSKAKTTSIVIQTTLQQEHIYANAADAVLSSDEILPPPKPLSPPSSLELPHKAISPEPVNSSPIRRLQAEPRTNSLGELIFAVPTEASIQLNNNVQINNSTSNLNPIRYHVMVEASNRERQARVRSLYPDAFSTFYRGNPMLQVGVFSTKEKAEIVLQSLENLGIKGIIVE
jgi:hypothetical protein